MFHYLLVCTLVTIVAAAPGLIEHHYSVPVAATKVHSAPIATSHQSFTQYHSQPVAAVHVAEPVVRSVALPLDSHYQRPQAYIAPTLLKQQAVAVTRAVPVAPAAHGASFVHSAAHAVPVVHSASTVHVAPAARTPAIVHSSAPIARTAPVFDVAPVIKSVALPQAVSHQNHVQIHQNAAEVVNSYIAPATHLYHH